MLMKLRLPTFSRSKFASSPLRSRKYCLCIELRNQLLCHSEGSFNDPLKIEQKITEGKSLQVQDEPPALPFGEGGQVEPYPDVAKDHRQAEKEQTQERVSGTGADSRFVHLAIGGFDRESCSVSFSHPVRAFRAKTPKGIDKGAPAVSAPLAREVAAGNTDLHRGRLSVLGGLACFQRVRGPSTLLPGCEGPRARSRCAVCGLASPLNDGHQEGASGRLQIANHRHAVEPAIQQQKPALDAMGACLTK